MGRIIATILILAELVCQAAVNREYGRTDGQTITYAPMWLTSDLVRPKHAEYVSAGWYRIAVQPPSLGTNQVVSAVTYAVSNDQVVAVYSYANAAPPVVRYSKRKLSLAMARRGLFERFDQWARTAEAIPQSGLTVARLMADSQYMKSDDADFQAVRAVAVQMFGESTIAELLRESEDEEW